MQAEITSGGLLRNIPWIGASHRDEVAVEMPLQNAANDQNEYLINAKIRFWRVGFSQRGKGQVHPQAYAVFQHPDGQFIPLNEEDMDSLYAHLQERKEITSIDQEYLTALSTEVDRAFDQMDAGVKSMIGMGYMAEPETPNAD